MTRPRIKQTAATANPGNLAERILDAFPSGAYALTALLRLLDVVETTAVPTAAVECRVQPRLLVNPEFVARHAPTPETLLMLVMHELHHVLLGHTTLFPRVTAQQNFVFDAVINGLVCRMFPGADHTRFFTGLYRADAFPECLLRPPPGWPDAEVTAPGIEALPPRRRRRAGELHRALYSDAGASYEEVFGALPRLLTDADVAGVTLLGHHGGGVPDGTLDRHAPVLFEAVRSVAEQWPQPPEPIRGRSLADLLETGRVEPRRPTRNRAALRRLILAVADLDRRGRVRQPTTTRTRTQTAIPTLDRRSVVLRALGHPPLLHASEADWRSPWRRGERVHVYLDVSGSMDAVKHALYGAALDCAHLLHPEVHLFSNRIADIGLAELRRGVCHSTGGTDIACVAEHMADHRVRRAVLITDGWTGKPEGRHRQTLERARIGVALLGATVRHSDLEPIADHLINLDSEDQP